MIQVHRIHSKISDDNVGILFLVSIQDILRSGS